jgi:hypothetical protein
MQCLHESNRYENMMDLAVEIQGCVETLEDALTQFTAPEWLDGDNKYKCDRLVAHILSLSWVNGTHASPCLGQRKQLLFRQSFCFKRESVDHLTTDRLLGI